MQHAVKTLDNSAHVPMSARALSRVDSNRHHGTARPQESRDTANGQNNRSPCGGIMGRSNLRQQETLHTSHDGDPPLRGEPAYGTA
ncbi:hypothetical protein NDU88_002428 [Pleurodeles waltl]|uniref:Uncharacterized protein n=1 Tax=Pleurodeles waltl TaxID=8319 RepID=A0AAV7RDW4_PLEWA|nr:hypothetical protein NDU88_002428 [Pleurodeles waltl]